MYYPHLTAGLKEIIRKEFPYARPVFTDVDFIPNGFRMACYLLWMLDQLQTFAPDEVAQRGRCMGYISDRMEVMGLLTNKRTRELTRLDVEAGSPM